MNSRLGIKSFFISLLVTGIAACGGGGSSDSSLPPTDTNTIPIADAGPAQTVTSGSVVRLDGSSSFDPDGDTLTYSWSFMSIPDGSSASMSDAALAQPEFTADIEGAYVISLVVGDGKTTSSADTVTISASDPNPRPVADAGPVQNVLTGTTVTLDGSASYDPNGDPITYAWSFDSIPGGSTATLSDPTSAYPTFVPEVVGEYVARLVVNDGTSDSPEATVVITAAIANAAPVADAGMDQSIVVGSLVSLDGSASSDSNGDPITYAWTWDSVPAGSSATISDASAVQPTFTADIVGEYVASLIVNDGLIDSAADSVVISATAANAVPVADAGAAQNVLTGSLVTLDGSASYDSDGDSLIFAWSFTSVPTGSSASLIGTNTATPQFTVDVDGIYVVNLIVNDGEASSVPDSVTVTASTNNTVPVADAGPDQNVLTGVAATLDGTGSYDADGDPLTYLWSVTSAPVGSTLAGQTATDAIVTFAADVDGAYVISLQVDDGQESSAADTVTLTASTANAGPVANAGPDQAVYEGTVVVLDGTGSSDANGDPLTYTWSLISQPAASGSIPLTGQGTATPSFIPPVPGSYVISLVVSDGTFNSAADTVVVTALAVSPPFVAHFLYGGTGNSVYLGCLNCNSVDAESVCNQFGNYGSPFAVNSIWNQFGTFGSEFNTFSPWNSFSYSGPAIIGSDGLFYGYFTTNTFRVDRTLNPAYLNVLDYYSATGNLDATRVFACGP